MAGHSHSSNIAVRKGKQDAKRAVEFSKASKLIMIAARTGADPDANFQLRHAIQKAKAISVPRDKIEHAIKKGAGLLEGQAQPQSVLYEGYGPSGAAILIECLTDNPHRTGPMIRTLFDKYGGSMGAPGSVSYLFKRKGLFVVEAPKHSKEQLEELLILEKEFDVSVEEISSGKYEILCPFEQFQKTTEFLNEQFTCEVSELSLIPDNQVEIPNDKAEKVVKLIQGFEELEDCANVYSNVDFSKNQLD